MVVRKQVAGFSVSLVQSGWPLAAVGANWFTCASKVKGAL